MQSIKAVDLGNWELTDTHIWLLSYNRRQNAVYIRHSSNPLKDANKRNKMAVSFYQKQFNKEQLLICTISFFRKNNPHIQIWTTASDREISRFKEEISQIDFFDYLEEIQGYYWQKQFYWAVRANDEWFRLEEEEMLLLTVFYAKGNQIQGALLEVVDINYPCDTIMAVEIIND